jgi:hypothetical protein
MITLRNSLVIAAFAALVPGCSKSVEGSCERIVEACHDADQGSGAAHDCHELAEADGATDESCAEKEDECVTACKPSS